MSPRLLHEITEEHHVIAMLLDLLEVQLNRVASGGTADLDLLRLVLRYTTEYPDRVHHPKEEVLFALVKQRAPRVAPVVDVLTTEHANLPDETARFTRLVELMADDATISRSLFVTEGRAYVARQRQHMERENAVVLPTALAALTAEDWATAEAGMVQVDDPLLGEATPGAYRRLRDLLLGGAS